MPPRRRRVRRRPRRRRRARARRRRRRRSCCRRSTSATSRPCASSRTSTARLRARHPSAVRRTRAADDDLGALRDALARPRATTRAWWRSARSASTTSCPASTATGQERFYAAQLAARARVRPAGDPARAALGRHACSSTCAGSPVRGRHRPRVQRQRAAGRRPSSTLGFQARLRRRDDLRPALQIRARQLRRRDRARDRRADIPPHWLYRTARARGGAVAQRAGELPRIADAGRAARLRASAAAHSATRARRCRGRRVRCARRPARCRAHTRWSCSAASRRARCGAAVLRPSAQPLLADPGAWASTCRATDGSAARHGLGCGTSTPAAARAASTARSSAAERPRACGALRAAAIAHNGGESARAMRDAALGVTCSLPSTSPANAAGASSASSAWRVLRARVA